MKTTVLAMIVWILFSSFLTYRNRHVRNGMGFVPSMWGAISLVGLLCVLLGLAHGYGLLTAYDDSTLRFSLGLITLGLMVGSVGVAKIVGQANERTAYARLLADKDPLTGLWNRNVLIRRLQDKVSGIRQYGGSLAFLLVDVDNFKLVNDLHGHAEGDRILRDVARIIADTVRPEDLVVRYGGDEFAILIHEPTTEILDDAVTRLQHNIKRLNPVGNINLGLSIGVSECPGDGFQVSSITAMADQRMYAMKRGNRPDALIPDYMPEDGIKPEILRSQPERDVTQEDFDVSQADNPSEDGGDGDSNPGGIPFRNKLTWVFWTSVILIGSGFVMHSVGALGPNPLSSGFPIWFLLSAGTAIGEMLELEIVYRGAKRSWTFSDAFIVALMYIFPDPVVVLTVTLCVVIGDLYKRKPWYKILFNLATYAVSLAFGCMVKGIMPCNAVFKGIIPIICGAVAYYAINNFLIYTMVGLVSKKSPMAMYRYDGQITFFVFACLTALGVGLGLLHDVNDILGFLLLLPIFCVYYTYNKYIDLQAMTETTLTNLVEIIEKRDPYTFNHSLRVAELAVRIGEDLRLSEKGLHTLELFGRLHDIGKVGISDVLLLKPSIFNIDEVLKMQQHPVFGYEILKDIKHFGNMAQSILTHHERWDGKGYPQRLTGTNIPLMARILAVADTYDAMTSDRPYRKAMAPEYAIAEIIRQSGLQFDPIVVESFLKVLREDQEGTEDGPLKQRLLGYMG